MKYWSVVWGGVSVCYSWEAIKHTENNYLFFNSIFDNTVILYWRVIYHDLLVFYTVFHAMTNRSWRNHQDEQLDGSLHIQSLGWVHAEQKDMTHFHASIAGERASGKRSIVCWWSPVAYHFSATALQLFSSVRSMRPTVSPTCNPGPYSDSETCEKWQMPLHSSELLLKRMLCMEAKNWGESFLMCPGSWSSVGPHSSCSMGDAAAHMARAWNQPQISVFASLQ